MRSMLPNREEASAVLQDVIVVLWQKFESAQDFKRRPARRTRPS